ncbi:MAG: hypothetical protein IJH63_10440 [Methanobrevibacter sp.]|nr:hypothetical protein [Methanobrevibacter sp.]
MIKRFETIEDKLDDCITITDIEDKLKTSFDSEIILYPIGDASIVIDELNIQCAIVEMLKKHLGLYEAEEDIKYWIDEVREDYSRI